MITPKRGDVWTHKNGIDYVVLYVTNLAHIREDHPPDVVYATKAGPDTKHLAYGSDTPAYDYTKIWSRPLSDWSRSFTRSIQ